MVAERQARTLLRELTRVEPLVRAEMRSERDDGPEVSGGAGGEGFVGRQRGIPDAPGSVCKVWPEVEGLLERAPGLSARTIFELLRGREGASFGGAVADAAAAGEGSRARRRPPEKELMSAGAPPREYGQSDSKTS